jgi:ethanolamine permease
MHKRQDGIARYVDVAEDYLHKRKLKKSAGWFLLWSMGVGAVISGDYFGWNFGLRSAGFWGMAIATCVMAIMYVCMVFSIAELSAALPHAGGFYSFVRNALGPTAGYVCGVTDTIEYVISPAVIVVGIGGYLNTLVFGPDHSHHPAWAPFLWWTLSYGIFVYINLRGAELTLKVGLVITALAVAVLLFFYVSVIARGAFDANLLFNIPAEAGHQADGLPFGVKGIFAALPFAIWFYLAIEQLPLAAEETHDVVRDMPKALIWGIATLLVLSLLTLVLNSGVGGGAAAMSQSDAPLADGVLAVFQQGATTQLLTLIALTGLVASFHAIIYAYGRVLFSLSRAGYFPRWISLVNRHHAPQTALLIGAALGLGCAILIHTAEQQGDGQQHTVGAALLNMAVFGAVVSYTLVMVSFISLRLKRPDLPRPYRSALGIPGAVLGLTLSLVALLACFNDASYRPAVIGTAIFLAIGLAYYFLYSRSRLVAQAPEEEVALIAQAARELD